MALKFSQILFIVIWVYMLVPTPVTILLAVPITILVLFVFSRRIQKVYQRMEKGFLTNLNAREKSEADDTSLAANIQRKNSELQFNMEPWDAHIVEMKVNPNAEYIGKNLLELGWREKFGINIVYIKRGDTSRVDVAAVVDVQCHESWVLVYLKRGKDSMDAAKRAAHIDNRCSMDPGRNRSPEHVNSGGRG